MKKIKRDIKVKGKSDEEAVVDIDRVYDEYMAWRENRWKYGSGVDTTKEEKWLQPRAKMLDMDVSELLLILRKRYRFGEVEKVQAVNQEIRKELHGL